MMRGGKSGRGAMCFDKAACSLVFLSCEPSEARGLRASNGAEGYLRIVDKRTNATVPPSDAPTT